jgi:hypothetical protein
MAKLLSTLEMAKEMAKHGKPISVRRVRAIAQQYDIGVRFNQQRAFERADVVEMLRARGIGRDYSNRRET